MLSPDSGRLEQESIQTRLFRRFSCSGSEYTCAKLQKLGVGASNITSKLAELAKSDAGPGAAEAPMQRVLVRSPGPKRPALRSTDTRAPSSRALS